MLSMIAGSLTIESRMLAALAHRNMRTTIPETIDRPVPDV
jgi:hypothetical protein